MLRITVARTVDDVCKRKTNIIKIYGYGKEFILEFEQDESERFFGGGQVSIDQVKELNEFIKQSIESHEGLKEHKRAVKKWKR